MADLQVTNLFATGETVSAANFNTNYSDIVTYVNNRNSGSSTWDAFYCTSETNVPLTANNSTGTQSIVQMKDNGTTVFEVFDGGYISLSLQTYARAQRASGTNVSSDNTLVTFTTITQTSSDYASSRFTCPSAGKYLINFSVGIASDSTPSGGTAWYVAKNGVAIYSRPFEDGVFGVTSGSFFYSDIISLQASDYIELFVNASLWASGATLQSGSRNRCSFFKLS